MERLSRPSVEHMRNRGNISCRGDKSQSFDKECASIALARIILQTKLAAALLMGKFGTVSRAEPHFSL